MELNLSLDKDILESIEKRFIILLDTSVWINLADEKSQEAIETKERLLSFSKKELIICPLTAPTIWELCKQKMPSLTRTSELMEELSLNVSFKGSDQIFDSEVDRFLDYLLTGEFSPLSTSEKFGSILSHLMPTFLPDPSIKFQDRRLHDHIANKIKSISLTEYVLTFGEKPLQFPFDKLNYQASSVWRRKLAGTSKEKARRIEQEYIARSIIIPKIIAKRSELPIEKQRYVDEKMQSLPRHKKYGDAIEYILNFMPALSAHIEICTMAGLNPNRKDKANDFYDRELLIYGLSYSTIFAAFDKWMASLISSCENSVRLGGLGFVSNFKALNKKLDILKQ